MQPEKYSEIRDLPLFAGISANSFSMLTRGAYVQNFPPSTELITEGDSADFLYIVLSGSVELFSSWDGQDTTMATVSRLGTFILAASIKDRPYLMSARTLGKTRAMLVPSEDIRSAFESDHAFSQNIVVELASCYRDAVRSTKNLKLRTSKERLANYLLGLHRRSGKKDSVVLPFEKRRLASFLGMTPENLSRSLSALGDYGVRVDSQTVFLEDLEGLTVFAKPHEAIDGD